MRCTLSSLMLVGFLAACASDEPSRPLCYLTAYNGYTNLTTGETLYTRKLVYDERDRITSRENYAFNIYGYRPSTIDSLIRKNGQVTEIRTVRDNGELKRRYTLEYENSLVSAVNHYYTRYNRAGELLTVFSKRETLEYDRRKRLILVNTVNEFTPQITDYYTAKYFYQDNNLSEVVEKYLTISDGDTTYSSGSTKMYTNYDSLRNPFQGLIFLDMRHLAYSQNNYRNYQEISYVGDNIDLPSTAKFSYSYNEHGYPKIGEYICE